MARQFVKGYGVVKSNSSMGSNFERSDDQGDPHNSTSTATNLESDKESWYLHLMSDHIPYRKDCLQCQVGAGRDRPRQRQKFQSTYEMSVDLAGPFERAPDQGRAKARYFMVATVKVPWMAEIGALV